MSRNLAIRLLTHAFSAMAQMNPPAIKAGAPEISTADVAHGLDPSRKADRFLPIGSSEDTVLVDVRAMTKKKIVWGSFLSDEEIVSVILRPNEFNREFPRGAGILYGRTPFMRAVVRQVGMRGCQAACAAMMCLDHRLVPSWGWVEDCYFAKDDLTIAILKQRGIEAVKYKLSAADEKLTAQQLEHLLKFYYAGILSVGGDLGNHVVMLDYFSTDYNLAIIREPYHGWCIATTAGTIMARCPEVFIGGYTLAK
jgi:hypothetical protein